MDEIDINSRHITEINGSLTLLLEETTDLSLSLSGYSNGTYYFVVVLYNEDGEAMSNNVEVVVQIPKEEPEPETKQGILGYNIYLSSEFSSSSMIKFEFIFR